MRFWYSTDEVPVADRADWYHDVVSRTVAPHQLVMTDPPSFRARIGVLGLGRIEVSRHRHGDHRALRTPRLIRQSDPEHYVLALIRRGSKGISQHRNDNLAKRGDMLFFDTSHPYSAGGPGPDDSVTLLLCIPRELIALPAARLDASLGSCLTVDRGSGAVLRRFLTSLESHGADCTTQEVRVLEESALALATGVLARELGAWDTLPTETQENLLLQRVDVFIERHIGDPALAPEAIAAHHGVSLRLLQRLFQGRGETIAVSIRRRRLARCRADLLHTTHPVHVIAGRWGFGSAAAFSRVFRADQGIPPREFRRRGA
ncbi:helix-turn-helix domain-containing protein [Streptomyces sp. NPDC091377]|uniref:AraC-like ligand-binding domain-containing protein n=1 Tax=Streptomyces sp. NPDC091377 TaxID=3365995 RepID=UPI00380AEC3A